MKKKEIPVAELETPMINGPTEHVPQSPFIGAKSESAEKTNNERKNAPSIKNVEGGHRESPRATLYRSTHADSPAHLGPIRLIDPALGICPSNLYRTGDAVPTTPYRTIWHDERRIFIKKQQDDWRFFTEYEPKLYSILCNTCLTWEVRPVRRSKGTVSRLRARIGRTWVNFSDMVWAYHAGQIDPNDIPGSLIAAKQAMRDAGLEIDHLRDNTHNNCIHNLLLCPKAWNATKSDLVTRINAPYLCIPVRVGEHFRVLCGTIDAPQYLICQDADALLELIQGVYARAKTDETMRPRPRTPGMTACYSQLMSDDGQLYHRTHARAKPKINPLEWLLAIDEAILTPWPAPAETK